MEKIVNRFRWLVIETQSFCNRVCETCLRQTHHKYVEPKKRMPEETVYSILDQAWGMGHRGMVCFQFFNEPLLDERLVFFGERARRMGFNPVTACTNGDLLTPELAKAIDASFHQLNVAFYDKNLQRRNQRVAEVRSLFSSVNLGIRGGHNITHYDPRKDLLDEAIEARAFEPCTIGCRTYLIIAHDGGMRACCQDIIGEFGLGNIHETNLKDLWFGEKHQKMLRELEEPGGRKKYPYCLICPK